MIKSLKIAGFLALLAMPLAFSSPSFAQQEKPKQEGMMMRGPMHEQRRAEMEAFHQKFKADREKMDEAVTALKANLSAETRDKVIEAWKALNADYAKMDERREKMREMHKDRMERHGKMREEHRGMMNKPAPVEKEPAESEE